MSELKKCSRCGEGKPTSEFYRYKTGEIRRPCQKCIRRSQAKYREANREKIRRQKNEAYRLNPEPAKMRAKVWAQENRDHVLREAKRRSQTPDAKARRKAYYEKNRTRLLLNNHRAHRRRMQIDPEYKLIVRTRTRIYQALRGHRKAASTSKLLGAPLVDVRRHLENQFKPGMTWKNHGKQHVDHIRPCASFDLSDPAQQKICFHYTNLQPLWAHENLSKHARVPESYV